jgi:hypothetical protein
MRINLIALLITSVFCCYTILAADSSKTDSKALKNVDVNDNRGNTPFFLQDPYDQMCLGPNGFTVCDEAALWVLLKRKGRKTYSLVII